MGLRSTNSPPTIGRVLQVEEAKRTLSTAHQATVEIREAQMNSKGKKKKLAIIDYGKMTQGGMTGKGRAILVRRLPRTLL